ncbi:light harvesting complex protein 2 [Pavlovales sp. CCMP2436]|nr:light harvesting complex protein 2 [Pavlovales sp. CCMP2436]
MGFALLGDLPTQESRPSNNPSLKWLREAELKHGRICMLAFAGTFVQTFTPTLVTDVDWFKASSAYASSNPGGAAQILLGIALVEGQSDTLELYSGGGSRAAGNLGFDPLGLSKGLSQAKSEDMQLKELKNGRLAMIAWAALVSSKFIAGSVPGLV